MSNAYFYDTTIDKLVIVENGTAITRLYFNGNIPEDAILFETPLLKKANEELQEYLNGKRKEFDLPLAPKGTVFQQEIWKAVQGIPYGKTCSYKDIAMSIGRSRAPRAVGMANSKNPILILIPCHRVIGTDGGLVGYAGGIDIKEKLLKMERNAV